MVVAGYAAEGVLGLEDCIGHQLAGVLVLQPVEGSRTVLTSGDDAGQAEFGKVLGHRGGGFSHDVRQMIDRHLPVAQGKDQLHACRVGQHREDLDGEFDILTVRVTTTYTPGCVGNTAVCIHTQIIALVMGAKTSWRNRFGHVPCPGRCAEGDDVVGGRVDPEKGRLVVDGRPAPLWVRPRIAWCPQESHLFTSTLRANLQLARKPGEAATEEELMAAIDAVGLAEMVAGLEDGLDAQAGPGASRLSGGQRERLAVARALLTRANVVLLDGPTAHLDRDGARSLLTDLRRGLPATAVHLVTHDAGEAALCEDVVVLGAPCPARAQVRQCLVDRRVVTRVVGSTKTVVGLL